MSGADNLSIAAAALILEAVFGYPPALYRRIGHPVTWIGALIAATELRINQASDPASIGRLKGALSLLFWLALTAAATGLIVTLCGLSRPLILLLAILAASLPAQRSLYQHVEAVADALESSDLLAARQAVARIVGRDTAALDEAGVARAAIESLAENFSDGIVAPAFWLAIGGLVGGALYKTINTADSMIGHRNKRYEFFGWAAARLDDLVNLPAARLAAAYLLRRAMLCAPCGAMPPGIGRPMPAGRKRRWPALWGCNLPDRDSINTGQSTTPSWATAGARRMPMT